MEVRDYYATLPGNHRAAVYSGGRVDGRSGVTATLWASDQAMMNAAYRPGHHRTQMEYQRKVGHFDFSSFTRARILAAKGTWDGADPVQEIAGPPAVETASGAAAI
jgi:hypothetical protein